MEISSPVSLGALAARAHDFLLDAGHPVTADALVAHVFGRTAPRPGRGQPSIADFWRGQLARLLADATIFTQLSDGTWALTQWGERDIPLDEMDYVVVDTETTGLDPATQRVIEIGALRCRGPL